MPAVGATIEDWISLLRTTTVRTSPDGQKVLILTSGEGRRDALSCFRLSLQAILDMPARGSQPRSSYGSAGKPSAGEMPQSGELHRQEGQYQINEGATGCHASGSVSWDDVTRFTGRFSSTLRGGITWTSSSSAHGTARRRHVLRHSIAPLAQVIVDMQCQVKPGILQVPTCLRRRSLFCEETL